MITNHNRRPGFGTLVLAIGMAAVTLAGCAESDDRRLNTFATWKQAEPLPQPKVQRVDVQHVVAFTSKSLEMSEIEREALGLFVRQANLQPGTHVSIAAPTKTAAQAARAQNRLASVSAALQRYGVSSSLVSAEPTNNLSTGDEIVVFAQSIAVLPPDCPGYNTPIAVDFEWQPNFRLGCANAINLGLMVANPSDLAQGRPLGPGDAEALALGISRYRAGKVYPGSSSQDSVPFRINTN